jgi:phenylacetate-CoA ligase
MTSLCEVDGGGSDGLARAIADSLRAVCNLRGEVTFAAPGVLPNDGKVIDDLRKYD